MTRVWADRGSCPRAVRQTQYQWVYLFWAVCPATGACNGWLMPTANTDTMNIQLKDLSKQVDSDVQVLLIWDQAGWHTSKGLKVPGNITPLPLPPYSPELNPVELIWRYLRRHYLSNRRYRDHDALFQAGGEAWNKLADQPDRIRSMCSFPWIESAINN